MVAILIILIGMGTNTYPSVFYRHTVLIFDMKKLYVNKVPRLRFVNIVERFMIVIQLPCTQVVYSYTVVLNRPAER